MQITINFHVDDGYFDKTKGEMRDVLELLAIKVSRLSREALYSGAIDVPTADGRIVANALLAIASEEMIGSSPTIKDFISNLQCFI